MQRLRPGRPLPDGAGRPADRGPVRRGGPHVQGAPAGGGRREQFYETDPTKPYKRGCSIQTVCPLPITWAEHVAGAGPLGRRRCASTCATTCTGPSLGALCELLPQPDNRVTLAEETDRHGLPVARFSYTQCDNDRALIAAAQAVMEDILQRGRRRARSSPSTGTPTSSAAPGWPPTSSTASSTPTCRTFAVPNLLITDGSVLPTQGAANPALTIMAVAARAADHLIHDIRTSSTHR